MRLALCFPPKKARTWTNAGLMHPYTPIPCTRLDACCPISAFATAVEGSVESSFIDSLKPFDTARSKQIELPRAVHAHLPPQF